MDKLATSNSAAKTLMAQNVSASPWPSAQPGGVVNLAGHQLTRADMVTIERLRVCYATLHPWQVATRGLSYWLGGYLSRFGISEPLGSGARVGLQSTCGLRSRS